MKHFLQRAAAVCAVLVCLTGVVLAGGQSDSASDSDVTVIKWFGTRGIPGPNAPIPPMLEEMVSSKVGFDVEFEMYGAIDNQEQKLQLMLAANELPDLFHVLAINEDFLKQAAAKFDLQEMMQYMPESTSFLKGLMDQLKLDEDETWAIYKDASDGQMWGTPRIWDLGWIPSAEMWRKDILDELGFDIPTTIAETEAVFAAYKAAYPDKYAMGGSGVSPTWQCFDQVWNAYGLVGNGHGVLDGKIKMHFTFPEFREALATLRSWYAKGYIDPEFITHKNTDKMRIFAQGNYITTEWLNRNNWAFDENATNIGQLASNVPGAVAVAAKHITKDENSRPLQRVWNPFLTQMIVFGKHLEGDHDKIHRIMQVADVISQDWETKLLAGYGIEGEHYTFPEGETAPQPTQAVSALSVSDAIDKFGFGFYWDGTFSTYTPLPSKVQKVVDEMVIDPDGILGSNNLDLWFPIFGTPVRDENGEDIDAMMAGDATLDWFVMTVKVVTGAEPLEYYDEWLEYYYKHGGELWEKHATRLYLPK